MKKLKSLVILTLIVPLIFTQCKEEDPPVVEILPTAISENFECGNIGEVAKITDTEWELSLANDNDNSALPDSWRCWWFVKMENTLSDTISTITIKNSGWPYYYTPVYSYDNKQWLRFTDQEVTQNASDELVIRKQFIKETVLAARFYPYSYTDLENYITTLSGNPFVQIETPGYSQEGNAIYMLKVSDIAVKSDNKERVFIHARTHPGETAPSFMLEGMIDFLASGSPEAIDILSRVDFYIFPMQNIDGVIAGNYRSTPLSENLEVMWYYDANDPEQLTSAAPPEVAIIHQYALELMHDGGKPITMALNLHASNSEPQIRPFFFPHFGTEAQGYTPEEAALWTKQLTFISNLATHYGADMLEPIPAQGGSSFATKTYPESWWWVNYGSEVMAITMELTYGTAGYEPEWITPTDMQTLGHDLALGIGDYYDHKITPTLLPTKGVDLQKLKYPALYPPLAEDEGKN